MCHIVRNSRLNEEELDYFIVKLTSKGWIIRSTVDFTLEVVN
jgi:hypothetical protein